MDVKMFTFLIVVVIFVTFAISDELKGGASATNSNASQSYEDDVKSIMDDLNSIGNDTTDTKDDFPSLADDVESLQDNYAALRSCHQKYPFQFQDCYRDISVNTNKQKMNFTDKEFQDYKCELLAALAECINLKTKIYCGDESGALVKQLTSVFKPQYDKECNQTGIIKSHRVQFSI